MYKLIHMDANIVILSSILLLFLNCPSSSLKITMNPANPPNRDAIDVLYDKIENDAQFLEEIDKIPFVETPLHTAATDGDIRLATEIFRLKLSFAWKLNPQGLSAMHLALQNGHFSAVRRFVSINKELVRIKGKKGLTPLHHAAEKGHTEILAEFLTVCPDSIEDLTVEGETALHIAVKEGQFEALQVLVGWLRRSSNALRESILNRKNESGETILHVSARKRDVETVKLLIKSGINLNAKNREGSTALDIVEEFANAEIKTMLLNAKAKHGSNVIDAPTLAKRLMSDLTIAEKCHSRIIAYKVDEKTTNVLVAGAALIATLTYQSVVSPPGGVYQVDASAASTNSNNSTFLAGKSVMSRDEFSAFWMFNSICLLLSTGAVCFLLPTGLFVGFSLVMAFIYFWFGYMTATKVISPTGVFSEAAIYIFMGIAAILYFGLLVYKSIVTRSELKRGYKESETESGGNKW